MFTANRNTETTKAGLFYFDICPLISPFEFCCVWTFAYALPSSISLTRSEICLPFSGPSSLSEVIMPCANTSLLGPEEMAIHRSNKEKVQFAYGDNYGVENIKLNSIE